jgi:hypothetical protein
MIQSLRGMKFGFKERIVKQGYWSDNQELKAKEKNDNRERKAVD